MSKIIDLSIFEKESLIFATKTGDKFEIPGELSTRFVIKLSKLQEKLTKVKDEEESFELLQQIVVDILSLDQTKEIDLDYVKVNFDDVRVLKHIFGCMLRHIQEIASDPNSNSPESE